MAAQKWPTTGGYIDYQSVWHTQTATTNTWYQPVALNTAWSEPYRRPLSKRERFRIELARTWRDYVRWVDRVFIAPWAKLLAPPKMMETALAPLPPMAGGAIEDEIEITREPPPDRKHKITLDRTVPIRRDKGNGPVATHSGKVEFVRQVEGPGHLTENVGIKTTPRDGGSYVEIPIRMVRDVLDELEGI